MKRKKYDVPTTDVVELKHTGILMTSVSTTMDGTFTEHDLAREFDFEDDDLSTLMDE